MGPPEVTSKSQEPHAHAHTHTNALLSVLCRSWKVEYVDTGDWLSFFCLRSLQANGCWANLHATVSSGELCPTPPLSVAPLFSSIPFFFAKGSSPNIKSSKSQFIIQHTHTHWLTDGGSKLADQPYVDQIINHRPKIFKKSNWFYYHGRRTHTHTPAVNSILPVFHMCIGQTDRLFSPSMVKVNSIRPWKEHTHCNSHTPTLIYWFGLKQVSVWARRKEIGLNAQIEINFCNQPKPRMMPTILRCGPFLKLWMMGPKSNWFSKNGISVDNRRGC